MGAKAAGGRHIDERCALDLRRGGERGGLLLKSNSCSPALSLLSLTASPTTAEHAGIGPGASPVCNLSKVDSPIDALLDQATRTAAAIVPYQVCASLALPFILSVSLSLCLSGFHCV